MRLSPGRIALGILGAIFIAVIGGGFWFNGLLNRPTDAANAATLTIADGDGVKEVADKLFDTKYLRSRWHWNLYMVLSGMRSSILPGTYDIDPAMSLRDIARTVTTPADTVREVAVKLLEGWTSKEMAAALAKAGVIGEDAFLDAIATTDSRSIVAGTTYGFLADKPATADMEGFLFPDTYRFFKNSKPAEVLKKLLDNFDGKLTDEMRQKIASRGRTIFDVVILASIVERELRTDRDRAMAADLFLRRLQAGIALQSDATVNYVTGKSRLQPTNTDLQVDSPYNTYRYPGLPPGPISNPGLSSLRAAVNPEPNDYLYFLTARDGTTHFSRTYDEHLEKKAKYLP